MVVAVSVVRVMKVPVDDVVDVVAVRDGLVPAPRSMHVRGVVPGAGVTASARIGVQIADGQHVLVDMVAMRVVQMTVV